MFLKTKDQIYKPLKTTRICLQRLSKAAKKVELLLPLRLNDQEQRVYFANMELENITFKGKSLSPVLSKGKKNMMIDIDGTICDDIPNEEPERMLGAKEYVGARDVINKWYDQGHIITFFTSRESAKHKEITEKWLANHGFKYHYLLMDKPRGGNYHWVDNHIVKGIKYTDSWQKISDELGA